MHAIPAPPARRTDLDLLRVAAAGGIVLAHALLIFGAEPRYHLKSAAVWAPATVAYEALHIATLAIFFALAGWSAVAALRRRPALAWLRERVARLIVPLAVGILLIGPVIKYVELRQGRDLRIAGFREVTPLELDFLSFLLRYPTRISLLTWSHLWFLAYLFVISLALLPLLLHLARRPLATALPPRLLAYAPAALLGLQLAAMGGYWPFLPNLIGDWGNLTSYALCFALGGAMASAPGFEARLRGEASGLLALGLAGLAGVVLIGESTPGRIAAGLASWGLAGAAFGFAARYAPPPSAALAWLGEATMPVYVIHHIPVLMLGLLLLPLGWPPALTIAVIATAAGAVSLGLWRWALRPYDPLRWLLGLAPAQPSRL